MKKGSVNVGQNLLALDRRYFIAILWYHYELLFRKVCKKMRTVAFNEKKVFKHLAKPLR